MCSQNLTRITPSSTIVRSKLTISSYARPHCSWRGEPLDALDEHPAVPAAVEHRHPAEAGDAGGRSATGSGAASRRTSAWRTSTRGSGAGRAARTTRLIAPPLPAASGPSNTSSRPGPSSPEPIWPPMCRRSCSHRRCGLARGAASYSLAVSRWRQVECRRGGPSRGDARHQAERRAPPPAVRGRRGRRRGSRGRASADARTSPSRRPFAVDAISSATALTCPFVAVSVSVERLASWCSRASTVAGQLARPGRPG